VYLDNRPLAGISGRIVLMPMRLKLSGKVLLVARGWQARDPKDRLHVTIPPAPAGPIRVSGFVRHQLDRVLQLGEAQAVTQGALYKISILHHYGKPAVCQFCHGYCSKTANHQRDCNCIGVVSGMVLSGTVLMHGSGWH
jgi:cytochrome oxidase assembly protein ShyY1